MCLHAPSRSGRDLLTHVPGLLGFEDHMGSVKWANHGPSAEGNTAPRGQGRAKGTFLPWRWDKGTKAAPHPGPTTWRPPNACRQSQAASHQGWPSPSSRQLWLVTVIHHHHRGGWCSLSLTTGGMETGNLASCHPWLAHMHTRTRSTRLPGASTRVLSYFLLVERPWGSSENTERGGSRCT